MKKTIKLTLAALALAVSGAANATLIGNLGLMSPGETEIFGHSFTSAGDFSDEWQFSLTGTSDGFGGTLTIDPLSFLDINIQSLVLWRDGTQVESDSTPGLFSFNSLIAGSYSLFVNGSVTRGQGWDDALALPVGYAGSITTHAVRTPVPEPGTLALLGLSLAGFGFKSRRRAR